MLLKEGSAMVKQNNNSNNTSSQDSDEDEDDDDLRIVFQGEQQEDVFPHSTYQDEDEGNVLPLPGSNIKHARRLQPKDFCTPRDDPSPRALNVMGMLSQDSINSSNDNVVVSSKKTTTTMASSNNNQSMKKLASLCDKGLASKKLLTRRMLAYAHYQQNKKMHVAASD